MLKITYHAFIILTFARSQIRRVMLQMFPAYILSVLDKDDSQGLKHTYTGIPLDAESDALNIRPLHVFSKELLNQNVVKELQNPA